MGMGAVCTQALFLLSIRNKQGDHWYLQFIQVVQASVAGFLELLNQSQEALLVGVILRQSLPHACQSVWSGTISGETVFASLGEPYLVVQGDCFAILVQCPLYVLVRAN